MLCMPALEYWDSKELRRIKTELSLLNIPAFRYSLIITLLLLTHVGRRKNSQFDPVIFVSNDNDTDTSKGVTNALEFGSVTLQECVSFVFQFIFWRLKSRSQVWKFIFADSIEEQCYCNVKKLSFKFLSFKLIMNHKFFSEVIRLKVRAKMRFCIWRGMKEKFWHFKTTSLEVDLRL